MFNWSKTEICRALVYQIVLFTHGLKNKYFSWLLFNLKYFSLIHKYFKLAAF